MLKERCYTEYFCNILLNNDVTDTLDSKFGTDVYISYIMVTRPFLSVKDCSEKITCNRNYISCKEAACINAFRINCVMWIWFKLDGWRGLWVQYSYVARDTAHLESLDSLLHILRAVQYMILNGSDTDLWVKCCQTKINWYFYDYTIWTDNHTLIKI